MPVELSSERVGAVVLAAGQSRRMGRPKMVLPWGERTVIEQVVLTLQQAGVGAVTVVTGADQGLIKKALTGYAVRLVENLLADQAEMLSSLQVGLAAQPKEIQALLVCLGDQPRIAVDVVRAVTGAYETTGAALVVPSYQMKRGHPWLVERSLWAELLGMPPAQTMRGFLQGHAPEIHYVEVQTDSVLRDLDTPEDYARERPSTSSPPG